MAQHSVLFAADEEEAGAGIGEGIGTRTVADPQIEEIVSRLDHSPALSTDEIIDCWCTFDARKRKKQISTEQQQTK